MNKLLSILAIGALASCGDNLKVPTDSRVIDTSTIIDTPMGFPAAPTLGAQIDRLGRPAVNTVLNHGFDADATAAHAAKNAYNQDMAVGMWPVTYRGQFAGNLAILDSLDKGLSCVMGTCTASATAGGCGNQVLYNAVGGGTAPSPTSYIGLAQALADDQLYIDTTKLVANIPSSNQNYLAVELNAFVGIPNPTCGGRAPDNDVIDTSYSALAIGLQGFKTSDFSAFFGDGVGPHADVSDQTFPFLGPPN
jgi:hypothetical protein